MARPANEISVLDLVQAVDGDESMFRCTEIRKRGPSAVGSGAYSPACGIAATMWRAEEAWKRELAGTSIADIAAQVLREAPRTALKKGGSWLVAVLEKRV